MKRFSFTLEKVLAFRRRHLDASETRLSETRACEQFARRRAESLEKEFDRLSDSAARRENTTGAELRVTHGYLSVLEEGRRAELEAERKWERLRREQVKELLDIRRQVKLLERLRERKLSSYLKALNRQLENQTAESFLAKWVRESRK